MERQARSKQFFFEKKNQKNFICFGGISLASVERMRRAISKVFCFFFSKKKYFLALPRPKRNP
jgi:hypothetical protein